MTKCTSVNEPATMCCCQNKPVACEQLASALKKPGCQAVSTEHDQTFRKDVIVLAMPLLWV